MFLANVYRSFNEETRCPYEENGRIAAARISVLLNDGRKQLRSQVSKSATRIKEFCSKRKLGPIVGTTSIEASETENRIKTLLSPHKQKISLGSGSSDGQTERTRTFQEICHYATYIDF